MKTLTIKTTTDFHVFSKGKLIVDGEKYDVLQNQKTQYFEIPDAAENVSVNFQGIRSNPLYLSDNQHNAIVLKLEKQKTIDCIFSFIIIILSNSIVSYFQWNFLLAIPIGLVFFLLYYFWVKNKHYIKLEFLETNSGN